jgi:two-component system phosphate regulon response regulator PhoB
MNELVAILEDEPDMRALIVAALKIERFRVHEYCDGRGFLSSLATGKPALAVLDLMLPDMDGFEICRWIRSDSCLSPLPVIILTARSEEANRILGLELGADDYIVKPFSPRELAVRVKTVLRRATPELVRVRIDADDGLIIDANTLEAFADGQRLELTQVEFRILQLLASRPGCAFSRMKILDYLWGNEKPVTDYTLSTCVTSLASWASESLVFEGWVIGSLPSPMR